MNRKEIITADPCGRLPHGVKCLINGEIKDAIGINLKPFKTKDQIRVETRVQFPRWEALASADISEIKPILFPSLTESITVAGYNDGLAFVPYDEIVSKIHFDYAEETIKMLNNMRLKWDVLPFWIINMLNQWHCNYRLLPGEYIEATNKYK